MCKAGILHLVFLGFLLASCEKDAKTEPDSGIIAPSVTFNFKAMANSKTLVPNTDWYTNSSQDSLTVTKFNYYISNIKLKKEDGTYYVEPESYHLIEHVGGKTSFRINNVPAGNYNGVEFLIGVDSLRNVSGSQTGALDPGHGMFWTWQQGYIFFKLEGAYNTLTQAQKAEYAIHIGGFSGPYACLQKCSFTLPTTVSPRENHISSVSYNVLIDEIFMKPTKMGFDDYYAAPNERTFKMISDNYADMFVIDKIVN